MIFGYLKFLFYSVGHMYDFFFLHIKSLVSYKRTYGEKPTAHVYGITVNWCENNYSLSLDLLLCTLLSPESWADTINQEEFTLEMKPLSISETGS